MDFTWVNEEQNPRNNPNRIQGTSTSLSAIRSHNDVDINPQNVSFTQTYENVSSLRRSRADTMPSRPSTAYANNMFSNLMNNSLINNELQDIPKNTNDNVNNMNTFSTRHRSGSLTLPNGVYESSNSLNFSQPQFPFNAFEPSSPIDENTIASTLASLGLDDENSLILEQSSTQTASNRTRSFTVSGQVGNNIPSSMLNFNPFSPLAQSSVLHRPRAISLGMADRFSPFDTTQVNNTSNLLMSTPLTSTPLASTPLVSTPLTTTPLTSTPLTTAPTNLLSQSRLRMQQVSNESPLRTSYSLNNLADVDNNDLLYEDQEYFGQSDDADSPSSAQAQIPSRALWLGNINPSISVPDLVKLFSAYGQVESARILSDKECAFVNFTTLESAVAAKTDLESRLGSMLGGTPVRVGYGKADVTLAMALNNDTGPNAQGPTRSLWVGNIPANVNSSVLNSVFESFGKIEFIRILSNKNCAFINFELQEDAVRARKALQNKEILGPGTGAVRIGFARAPEEADEISDTGDQVTQYYSQSNVQQPTRVPNNGLSGSENFQAAQWATAVMMTNMIMNNSGQASSSSSSSSSSNQPSLYTAIASERHLIMQQLGCEPSQELKEDRIPLNYFSVIPPVPELNADRKLEPLRLREMRKRLENDSLIVVEEVDAIAIECMEEIVELCSDYIGNTVIQKLFEHCSDVAKYHMLQRIAPFLASIGVHKNGTWAAQKIIDYSNTPEQVELISQHIAPFVPLLLLDQFGNYVVQCCLRKGSDKNQYIFDAIVDKCWEIGQGRFGARSVRSILENSIVTKEQQVYVAAAVVQNTVLLTTNANGVLLLNWLLDTSNLPGRYDVLSPRLLPYLNKLSTHKLGSITVSKVINQAEEPQAAAMLLEGLSDKAKADLLNNNKK